MIVCVAINSGLYADFTIRVGDITYFTKSYEELLNKKLANQEGANSHEKGKRAVPVNENRLWTNCVLPYTIDNYYTGGLEKNKIGWYDFMRASLLCRQPEAGYTTGTGPLGGTYLCEVY